ncbi:MAG: FAD-dependent oxidoreductase [Betaproteobacteria bacterium]|jgi:3-(3-hydroxy-phenyl)propionate hydroxylase|nr:FAD-dependent oxidoreductase [Betaproteobacteria bacterium]
MLKPYKPPDYDYVPSPDQSAAECAHHPVIVVGAGPVGLTAAIDLARHGTKTVLLDEDNTVSAGSRAVCYAKRTLDILDRLGCGEPVAAHGVAWSHGRVFFRDKQIYGFNLLGDEGHRRPAFVNLQQYYLEEILVDCARDAKLVDLRWKNRVLELDAHGDTVRLTVETPDGPYPLTCDWLIVADGAHSSLRHMMGLDTESTMHQDYFLVADVVMKAEFPAERWFWFDPPFHPDRSVLLHKQADNVWRVDFQLGRDADPEEERKPERIVPRIRALLGDSRDFELQTVSVYGFQCRRMERFRHGRVLFAGDCARQVPPFGSRGANSGIQDADNLVWKLQLVIDGKAPEQLLETYSEERVFAADDDIHSSLCSVEFITPSSKASRAFRDATLELAEHHPFARRIVNSGRLSAPLVLTDSSLNMPDADPFDGAMVPGAPAGDAPIAIAGKASWLLAHLGGGFTGLYFAHRRVSESEFEALDRLVADPVPVKVIVVARPAETAPLVPNGCLVIEDRTELITRRYDGRPGTFYLIRPDQHVAARWRALSGPLVRGAVAHATCND